MSAQTFRRMLWGGVIGGSKELRNSDERSNLQKQVVGRSYWRFKRVVEL